MLVAFNIRDSFCYKQPMQSFGKNIISLLQIGLHAPRCFIVWLFYWGLTLVTPKCWTCLSFPWYQSFTQIASTVCRWMLMKWRGAHVFVLCLREHVKTWKWFEICKAMMTVTIQGPWWAFCGGLFVGKRRMVIFLSEWNSLECQNQYLIKAKLDRNNK